jgi:SPP1 gp7 family putative phage head morphogenesis protein
MFDPFTPAIKDYFENRSLKVVKDVDDETRKQLRATLSQGVQDGEGGYELRARVEAVFGNASTIRADRIARTETSRAQGFADVEAWTQSGVVSGKEFFTSEDEKVCIFCDEMDGKVVDLKENFFDKGDSLTVGDKTLQFNYDDISTGNLHVSCRCVLLPVRAE